MRSLCTALPTTSAVPSSAPVAAERGVWGPSGQGACSEPRCRGHRWGTGQAKEQPWPAVKRAWEWPLSAGAGTGACGWIWTEVR